MRESSLFPHISQVIQSGDNFINRRNMNSAPAAMCVSRCSALKLPPKRHRFLSSPFCGSIWELPIITKSNCKRPFLGFVKCEIPTAKTYQTYQLGWKVWKWSKFLLLQIVWSIWTWISFRKVPTNQWLNAQMQVLADVSPWKASCLGRHPVPCPRAYEYGIWKNRECRFRSSLPLCDSSVHWITTNCCRNTMRNLR